jgi:hypothetical protein
LGLANNLQLNQTKSAEIVFISPRSKQAVEIPMPAFPSVTGVELIKILGVTISRRFSIARHVGVLMAGCAQTLFALRTLQQHDMPTSALHAVFQATLVAKIMYAASAWWGFASAADRRRLEAFLR